MNNKFIPTLIALIVAVGFSTPICSSTSRRIELIYDGNILQKSEIQIFKGAEYISVKSAAVVFRGRTQWYPIAGKVILRLNNQKITFSADSRTAVIGSKNVSMNSPAKLYSGTLWVPLEFFLSDSFKQEIDCRVDWDSQDRILKVEPKASISPPRIYTRSNLTRIVLESTEPISPEVKKKKNLILVDIPKGRIANEDTIKIKDTLIESVKTAHARKGTSIKISLKDEKAAYSSQLKENPTRFILEIYNPKEARSIEEKEELVEKVLAPPQEETPTKKDSTATKEISTPQRIASKVKVFKIVVDAGHGGKDVGALGRVGTKEKNINLLIAIELARALRMEGYDVFLTRSDDTFIPLIDRTLLANEKKADLFISIHCNAGMRKREGGFEIYFLAEDATDSQAETIAEFENAAEQLEGPLSPQKQRLHDLLASMARTEFINESAVLCNTISDAVKKRVPVSFRGVKQADFHVLHGAQMPSVLVETAFLTNGQDEEKLRQRKFRSAMVDSIVTGVQSYEKKVELLKK